MKKQKIFKTTIFIMLITFIVTLSGCGVKKLSGTYVSELDDTSYVRFSGESKISFRNEDESVDGTYRIENNVVYATFPDSEDNSIIFFEIKDKKTLYYGLTTAFVKEGFWKRHWLKILIGFIVLGILGNVIPASYKKITGKDLDW